MANPTPNTTSASGKVTVACKLPNGIVLQLARSTIVSHPVLGGGSREATEFARCGQEVTVFGPAHPQNAGPRSIVIGDYALTPGVDAQFWAEWLKQNKEHPAVRNHLLFAYEKDADAHADAKEHAQVKSGLERLDPKNLPKGIKAAKEKESELAEA